MGDFVSDLVSMIDKSLNDVNIAPWEIDPGGKSEFLVGDKLSVSWVWVIELVIDGELDFLDIFGFWLEKIESESELSFFVSFGCGGASWTERDSGRRLGCGPGFYVLIIWLMWKSLLAGSEGGVHRVGLLF